MGGEEEAGTERLREDDAAARESRETVNFLLSARPGATDEVGSTGRVELSTLG